MLRYAYSERPRQHTPSPHRQVGSLEGSVSRRPILSHSTNQARRGSRPSHAPGITGRFVLLPKNVVTRAAKVDIMSHSTHPGRCSLWKVTLQAPPQAGLFF